MKSSFQDDEEMDVDLGVDVARTAHLRKVNRKTTGQ